MSLRAFDERVPEIEIFLHTDRRPVSDLFIIPVWADDKQCHPAAEIQDVEQFISGVLASGDFLAKLGDTLLLYQGIAERRILLVGLGKPSECCLEKITLAYFKAFRSIADKKVRQVVVALPTTDLVSGERCLKAFLEGFYFAQYTFSAYKFESEPKCSLEKVYVHTEPHIDASNIIAECAQTFRALSFVRDLVNYNADEMTPEALVDVAFQIQARNAHISCEVLEKKQIEELGMGLFLAVAKGSAYSPYLLHLKYQGAKNSADTTLFIGKAITFDTGGLQLKPSTSMDIMRNDMAGAAVLLGLLTILSSQQLPINVDVLIPVCENAIGSRAFKPGDMLKSMKGPFVEITSTDAEGRLCLADACTYGIQKIQPSRIVDIATLTGSMEIALGPDISGFLTNSEPLARAVEVASHSSGELFWRLPLHMPYKEMLKSDLADMKNTGGRIGGAIIAALFIQEFVENRPWVHIDIAGTAYLKESRNYLGKGATGVGLRMLIDFCKNLV